MDRIIRKFGRIKVSSSCGKTVILENNGEFNILSDREVSMQS